MPRKPQFRKLFAWSLLFIALFLLFITIAEEASARAGGGHSYSSGSRSGGGSSGSSGRRSSGGSGGGGDIIFLLIRLIFHYPLVGIPLTIFIIWLVMKGYFKADDHIVFSAISKVSAMRNPSAPPVSLSQLQSKDPGFDEKQFISRAESGFKIIQKAWTDRKLDSAQAFLSDGIFEQFSIQLAEMREKGIIDHMEGLTISSSFPVHFQTDKNFDVIHLRINARAINYRKDEKTGKTINGSRSPESFAEVWSFMRKPGAKTQKKPGLLEGQCPNCGNPIKIGRLSKCDVCNALLRSGEYDWVLTSITQACEWSVRPEKVIPGFAEITQADPGFNMQHIKERAAVMFWRKLEAERIGKIEPLRKISRNEFSDAQLQWLKPDNSGARRFFTNCAVGAIGLLGLELKDPQDIAYIEVIWSGWPSTQVPGQAILTADNPINFKHVFVLGRKHGAQTKLETTLASSHCPACGAPEQTSTANECAYCGSVMNDGKQEWVLESVVDRSDKQVSEIITRMNQLAKRQQPAAVSANGNGISGKTTGAPADNLAFSGLEMLRWTVAMMLADGQIDAKEMEMIKDLARKRDINETRLQQVVSELKAATSPVEHVMTTSQLQADRQLLVQLARVALADGALSNEEREMLLKVGQKISMTGVDIDMLLTRERNNLYREAKDFLRQTKKP